MSTDTKMVQFADLNTARGGFHITRAGAPELRLHGRRHSHDFGEVFWIETGRLRHVTAGADRTLDAGAMVFIRPNDVHELRPVGRDLQLMNLAIPLAALTALAERYYCGCGGWPWDANLPGPHIVDLTTEDVARLSGQAETLVAHAPTPLARDRFLLSLLDDVAPPTGPTEPQDGPAWLTDALARFRQPEHISRGRDGFIDLTGRSPEHVGRVVRRLFGRPLSAVLRDAQLDVATRLLTLTNRDIVDVAMDCGFGSLGYFYRCFRSRFGTSPRRYRLAHRRQPFQ